MSTSQARSFADETVKGWIGSILFHLLLIFIFYFTYVDEGRRTAGFVEVTLGSFGEAPSAQTSPTISDERPEASARASAPVLIKRRASTRLDLPERQFPVADEILRLPETNKLDVADEPSRQARGTSERRLVGEKEIGAGKSLEGEKLTGEGKRGTLGEGAGFSGSTVGADIGRATGYSIQWAGGGTRKKISGDLPTYPEGVNLEAQIRLQAVVAVDGSVKSLHPIQKAHEKLEEAAIKEVRFWKFEPLSISQPQVDQTCTITFNFKLQ
ncbi:MAG: energy transducer TonB [Bacteroidota bacterium]